MNNRRRFLQLLGASATLSMACEDEGTGKSEASGPFSAGNVSSLSANTIKPISGQPLVIARDAAGVYAMSAICTHEQCDMNSGDGVITNTGLVCTCHDSHFDANGNPTAGPARSQLKHYQVTLADSGELTILAGTVVSADTRVAVPSSSGLALRAIDLVAPHARSARILARVRAGERLCSPPRSHAMNVDLSSPCDHVDSAPIRDVQRPAAGCEDCLRIGGRWVHLRQCLTCGHVGCCDSSPNKHATAHFHATRHPIITSVEPGETWAWCYIDQTLLSR